MIREKLLGITKKNDETREKLLDVAFELQQQLFNIHKNINCVNNCLIKCEEINKEILKLLGVKDNE